MDQQAAANGAGHYGDWSAQWFYEFFKDVQTYSLLVIAVHAVAWFGRQRQGEAHLLAPPDDGPPVEPVERPQHFLVRKLGKEFLVATGDVEYAQAAGNYVNLRVRGHDYPLRITMAMLEQRLDPAVFLRPHRSWLIHRGQLRSIEPLDGGGPCCTWLTGRRWRAAGASCRCCGRRWVGPERAGLKARPPADYFLSFLIIASIRAARASEPGCEDIRPPLLDSLRNMLARAAGS